ncbi:hypothetical protein GPECTOR_342g81 [Gonium pectorale]|uniref:Chromo domain-containing protein n=1 Tax=Gonium pectorale TaxID=33097 RepID=A0A150FX94_GONPE|nr:hypothetical protein GPECTOR_342g81 [Gonium pectorale]|eukprot:KXZ41650.1 hypothetical protein GPECTOR_342g81 [Gonium pectorale]
MCHFAPTTDTADASDLARLFVDNVVRLHGFPTGVISDRDSKFISEFWAEVMRIAGVDRALSTSYHPETDGQTERTHRILQEYLRNYVNPAQNDWDLHLSMAEFVINNSYQASTKATPFQLNNCRNPRLPSLLGHADSRVPAAARFCSDIQENIERAKRCIASAQDRYKHYADQHRRETDFDVGQKVLLSTKNINLKQPGTKKLLPRWIGPFEILHVIRPPSKPDEPRKPAIAAKLSLPATYRIHNVFHVSLLKPYRQRADNRAPPGPIAILEDGPYWAIDRILAHRDLKRGKHTRREYWVSWEGYGPEHCTWEPEDNITPLALDEYWASLEKTAKRASARNKGEAAQPTKRQRT